MYIIFPTTQKFSVVSVWDDSMRSLCNETDKRTEISTFICDQHMDILFLTEIWLKPQGDEGRLHDLTAAGYIAKSFPRESRGGGIAVVYNKCLYKRISITATFCFHHQSFEVLRLSITLTSGNINLFFLHRPPPSRNNQLTDSSFFSEFSILLDLCNTLSSSSIILEDINVHFDIPTNPLVLKINSLLNRYSFYKSVTVPTHKFGHTLDIAMLRTNDDIVCSTTVTQLLSSDHYCAVCDLSVIKPANHAELKQSRNLRGINLTTSIADICQLISPTLCPSFEMLDDNLRLILEKHALLHSCRVPINQNDPWYNAMKSDIIASKEHRHWAERQHLKYPTILNKQQFNKAKNSMVKIMQKAKS